MKIISRFSGLIVLITGCAYYADRPVKWYDEQGHYIARVIEQEFDIPIDEMSGRKGVYNSGWAYRSKGGWQTGSLIEIYGIADAKTQDAIVARVQRVLSGSDYCDVVISFKAESRYKTEGGTTIRLPAKEFCRRRVTAEPTNNKGVKY